MGKELVMLGTTSFMGLMVLLLALPGNIQGAPIANVQYERDACGSFHGYEKIMCADGNNDGWLSWYALEEEGFLVCNGQYFKEGEPIVLAQTNCYQPEASVNLRLLMHYHRLGLPKEFQKVRVWVLEAE